MRGINSFILLYPLRSNPDLTHVYHQATYLTKVNNKYWGPKYIAPFQLLLVFNNLSGLEIMKIDDKLPLNCTNVIFKHLEEHFGSLE